MDGARVRAGVGGEEREVGGVFAHEVVGVVAEAHGLRGAVGGGLGEGVVQGDEVEGDGKQAVQVAAGVLVAHKGELLRGDGGGGQAVGLRSGGRRNGHALGEVLKEGAGLGAEGGEHGVEPRDGPSLRVEAVAGGGECGGAGKVGCGECGC